MQIISKQPLQLLLSTKRTTLVFWIKLVKMRLKNIEKKRMTMQKLQLTVQLSHFVQEEEIKNLKKKPKKIKNIH